MPCADRYKLVRALNRARADLVTIDKNLDAQKQRVHHAIKQLDAALNEARR